MWGCSYLAMGMDPWCQAASGKKEGLGVAGRGGDYGVLHI